MKSRKMSFTTRYVVTFGVILFLANIILDLITLRQSESAMKTLINKNMLDVANSAAGLLDGDILGALTEADVGGDAFNDIAQRLTVFQKNVDIHFIYAVRQEGEGRYIFTVDPDPEDPADFGEEIVITDALIQAGKGIPTVDAEPMADRWGNFYSVYSPVFDSTGAVAGIVGMDFDARWYDEQVRRHTVSITIVTAISVLIGGIVVIMITHRVRKRFNEMDVGLSMLSSSMDKLMEEVDGIPGHAVTPSAGTDEIERLNGRIETMQKDMSAYLAHLRTKAYTDAMSGINNTAAYSERIKEIDAAIREGNAEFSVAVFDINSLKEINDQYGHEIGDRVICGAARAIADVFGKSDATESAATNSP